MEIFLHKDFKKAYKKLQPNLRKQAEARLLLFLDDPFNQLLNNHSLKGKYTGFRSINITGDLRAIYKMADDNLAHFYVLGTHSKLYK